MQIIKDSDVRSYFKLKSKYITNSEYDIIISLLNKIKNTEDSEYIKLKEKADLEFRKSNYKEALDLYSRYIEGNPNPIIFNNRSACFYKLKMFDESIEDCKQGLLLDERYIKFYLRLAVIYKELKNFSEATMWIKKGLLIEDNKVLSELLDQIQVNEDLKSISLDETNSK